MGFEIQLPLFQGPFDLLLFFVDRDELDIYDIPISKITDDFLAYLHQLEGSNLEVASEFILVASTLMSIKAKMLLPRKELDDKGNEIDPRIDLAERLLEYKKFKELAKACNILEDQRFMYEFRGNLEEELILISQKNNIDIDLQKLDLYKLLKVFQKVVKQFETSSFKPEHKVALHTYNMDEQKQAILKILSTNYRLSFTQMISNCKEKLEIIYNFLAILELLQLQSIDISIGEGYNNFWIEKK